MKLWLKIIGGGLLAALVILLTLPWWLGAAARPLLRAHDITFGNYERVGYARFQIDELTLTRPGVVVTLTGVEAPTPLRWLRTKNREAAVNSWRVSLTPTPAAHAAGTGTNQHGFSSLHHTVADLFRTLAEKLPEIRTGAGEVNWGAGRLRLAALDWSGGELAVQGLHVIAGPEFTAAARLTDGALAIEAGDRTGDLRAQLRWTADALTGTASFREQPATLDVRFAAIGWMPAAASLVAEDWDIPARQIGLDDKFYSRFTGTGRLEWRDGVGHLTARAKADPQTDAPAPPLEWDVAATGDHRALTIHGLKVDAPFAQAQLTAPVVLGFDGEMRGEPARLEFSADLAQLPWGEAQGRAKGTITVSGEPAALRQDLAFDVQDFAWRDFTLPRATVRSSLQWPRLEISRLELQAGPASRFTARGALDLSTRELEAVELDGSFQPGWLARWLPDELRWTGAELSATLSGPLAAPRHAGRVTLNELQAGPLKPVRLALAWQGTGPVAEAFSGTAETETSTLQFGGHADAGRVELQTLQLTLAGMEPLQLVAPVRLAWAPVPELTGLELRGGTRSLTLAAVGSASPSFRVQTQHLESAWLAAWLQLPGPAWYLTRLEAGGQTGTDGVLAFTLGLEGEIQLPAQSARVNLSATGDAGGVQLTALKVTEGDRLLTEATGRLPLRLVPQAGRIVRWEFDQAAPLELRAVSEPDSPLWAALAKPAGLELQHATARADLRGTLQNPAGSLQVEIATLRAPAGRWAGRLPEVTDLRLHAEAGLDTIRLQTFTANIEGQPIRAELESPMSGSLWRSLWEDHRSFDWRHASGRLEIPGADLTPLARRLPAFIAAQGLLTARLDLAPGGRLQGQLHLAGGATRPIPALGVVQDITATLAFAGHTITVDAFSGVIGGEAVLLQGAVTLPPGAAPEIDLALRGENVPLVRRAGLLVRSDLDLRAHTDGGVTRVSGLVNLRDGLVLADFAGLLPTGPRGVAQPPPYFAVEAAPFADWPLAVEVRGQRALRARTPVFHGTASAQFNLGGTLGDPRAVGELTVDEGRIFFPFATFAVQRGSVQLRESDPYTPVLNLHATSRRQNHELRLALTGAPDNPSLAFTSNPPLDPSAVLLLVMTGQTPASQFGLEQGGRRLTQLGAYVGRGIFRSLGGAGDASRLEIVSGERISQQGRETYTITYRLDDRWSLIGEYDEFDSYNATVKWHVYRREGADANR